MGNNTKYLFVIDIDGTLINTGDSEIKKNIVDEIENLKSKGHIFTISTGRNLNKILYYGTLKRLCIYLIILSSNPQGNCSK